MSAKKHDRRSDRNRMQSYIRPVVKRSCASGHHGHPRTEGQSLNSDLEGQRVLSAWLGAGPTGHAMIWFLAEHLVG